MKAKELIEFLSKVPPDSRIVVGGWEHGYDEATAVECLTITPNTDKPTVWHFEIGNFRLADEEEVSEVAVYIAGV